MLKLSIFIFFVVLIATSASFPEKDLIKLSKEYVHLTLVNDLSTAREKALTYEGRLWLLAWKSSRDKIVKHLTYYKDIWKNKNKLRPDWQVNLKKFEETKENYYRSLISITDRMSLESIPWPEITFNPDTSKTFVHPRKTFPVENSHLYDPIVTEEQIDEILRFHRPYTSEEKNQAQTAKDGIPPEIDEYSHTVREIIYYRPYVQKYYVSDNNRIEKLINIRYQLLRKSFTGKCLTDLHYEKALIRAKRINTEINLWYRLGIQDVSDDVKFFDRYQNYYLMIVQTLYL